MGEKKIVDLNRLGSVKYEDREAEARGFLRDDKVKKIVQNITDRIDELDQCRCAPGSKEEFNSLRGHDTILIDGQRGSGKTTLLLNIKNEIEHASTGYAKTKSKIYVFDVIDPTLINITSDTPNKTNSDILLMFVAKIYALVVESIEDRNCNSSKLDGSDDVKSILKQIKKINSTIIKGYDVDSDMDYQERLYALNDGLSLDYKLHELFTSVCKLLDKHVLVFPMDDIDMEMGIAYNIFDSIRRYMSSPRVIVIVAGNSSQAYGAVKQHFYNSFDLDTDKAANTINSDSGLRFLKGLPRAYMLKSFLPSRRVETNDMLDIYNYYNTNGNSLVFRYVNRAGIKFELESIDLLRSFVNVVYGAYNKYQQENVAMNRIFSDYLESLSMRAFISDVRNFLEAISWENEETKEKYVITQTDFRDNIILRFLDYTKKHNRKESVLVDVWDQFIGNANLVSKESSSGDILSRTFDVNGYDMYDRYTKTYNRLWMQTYFLDGIELDLKEEVNQDAVEKMIEKTNVECKAKGFEISFNATLLAKDSANLPKNITEMSVKKHIDLMGVFELALRTFIPMHITRRSLMKVNEGEKDAKQLKSSDILYLKSFLDKDLKSLIGAIPGLERRLESQSMDDAKYLGCITRLSNKDTQDIALHDWVQNDKVGIEHGSMSFFKSLILFMEFSDFLDANRIGETQEEYKNNLPKIKKFLYKYMPVGCYECEEFVESLNAEAVSKLSKKLRRPKLVAYNSSFGIKSISQFSKRVVKNFSYIYEGIHGKKKRDDILNCIGKEKNDRCKEQTKMDNVDYYMALYVSAFLNALLIEFIDSLNVDIPLNKKYIYVNDDDRKGETRKLCAWLDNLLFRNLKSIETAFDENITLEQEVKDSIFSIVIFVVRILKYYNPWRKIFKSTYNYGELYIAKKRDEETKEIKSFNIVLFSCDNAVKIDEALKEAKEGLQDKGIKGNELSLQLDDKFYSIYKDWENNIIKCGTNATKKTT
jgi:hypothetical protein